jgi:hypothetical protein
MSFFFRPVKNLSFILTTLPVKGCKFLAVMVLLTCANAYSENRSPVIRPYPKDMSFSLLDVERLAKEQ